MKEAMEKKYGAAYEVRKEECVGHVQKRLGTALKSTKKDKNLLMVKQLEERED